MIRVLVCDDEPAIRTLLGIVFGAHPEIDVVGEAGDGRTAVSEAGRLQPDVVLLDLSMPELDGLEALPEIRVAAPAAKVIVLSGFPAATLGEEAAARGASRFLEKGAAPDEIVRAVEEAHAA